MKKFNFSNKFYFRLWLFFHTVIILAFCVSLIFTKGIIFDADFSNMMPSTVNSKASAIAEKAISKNSNSTIFILVSHEDFKSAKEAAIKVYDLLKNENTKFKSLSLYSDISAIDEAKSFLAKYRFNLLDDETITLLKTSSGAQTIAENALASVYSGFSIGSLENIESDPFMLDERNLSNYIKTVSNTGTAMFIKDGVLASQFDDRWYVMIRGELTSKGAQLASKKNAVPLIYEKCLPLEKDGVQMTFYGTPYHSYKSSSSATKEISIISAVSLMAVTVIVYVVFRSAFPIVASIFSILLSLGTAFCATHLAFGQINLISLIFGTSLIGSSIDYSLHYFMNWKSAKEFDSTEKIRRHIFNGLLLSLVSTEICFIMLVFAPFELLKQMAIFSSVGILSSFLTVSGFFTMFSLPSEEKRKIALLEKLDIKIPHRKIVAVVVPVLIFVSACLILLFNKDKLKIQNNIANLYKMEGRLKEDTLLAYQVLAYNPSGWLVIEGNTAEEVLQIEEEVSKKLTDNFVSTSRFIPSIKKQKEAIESAKKLLPLLDEQLFYLGFDADSATLFTEGISKAESSFLTPESEIPKSIASLINTLWIGNVDGKFYSVILPSKISDEEFYKSIANSSEHIFYENKVKDVSLGLDRLTEQILLMFAIAFVIIAIIMKKFYSLRDTLKILSIPILCVMTIFSVFVVFGLKIEFFCITGLILVFGLGLDYIIYKTENKNNKIESFAIALSFITTAISFGSLALSSFVPVHVMGLSIFSGLVTAFVCAML